VPAISRGETRGGEVGSPASVVLSALKFAVVALDTLIVCPIVVVVALVDQPASYRICQLWARLNLRLYGVTVRTRRLAPLDPTRAYVFMSNHRSQFDILAVIVALSEFQLRWVAKVELTRIPVFGWALRRTGHVIIDRSAHDQAVASLRAAHERMERERICVTIFPEGTRSSSDETLLPFKKGGFMLALETGVPIVPIAVRGSREVLPRGSWQPTSGEIDVVVGAPIAVAGVDRDELMERVRAFMLAHIGPGSARAGDAAAAAV
jgi:1-acyl-sn-glycerol-3-phosphate acyltransferase